MMMTLLAIRVACMLTGTPFGTLPSILHGTARHTHGAERRLTAQTTHTFLGLCLRGTACRAHYSVPSGGPPRCLSSRSPASPRCSRWRSRLPPPRVVLVPPWSPLIHHHHTEVIPQSRPSFPSSARTKSSRQRASTGANEMGPARLLHGSGATGGLLRPHLFKHVAANASNKSFFFASSSKGSADFCIL